MNAPVRTRPNAPARVREPGEAGTGLGSVFGDAFDSSVRYFGGSTPGRMRALSLLCLAAIALAGVFTTLAALRFESATNTIANNTAPVLTSTQDVYASLAEANSAATALDNPVQQGIYRAAIDSASRDLEEVSRLVGDDPESHAALQEISADLTRYVREMESARNMGVAGDLGEALDIVQSEIARPLRNTVTTRATDRFNDQVDGGFLEFLIGMGAVALAIIVLVVSQMWLTGRTNRLLNIPLVLATILVLLAGVLLFYTRMDRQDALNVAQEEALASIQITGDIQEELLDYRNDQADSLLTGAPRAPTTFITSTRNISNLIERLGNNAGSARERAAATELNVRWDRYRVSSELLDDAVAGADLEAAQLIATDSGLSSFNGMNTAVESVLFDNRAQFLEAIEEAQTGLRWRWLVLLGLIGFAAIFALWGWGQRIGEYR